MKAEMRKLKQLENEMVNISISNNALIAEIANGPKESLFKVIDLDKKISELKEQLKTSKNNSTEALKISSQIEELNEESKRLIPKASRALDLFNAIQNHKKQMEKLDATIKELNKSLEDIENNYTLKELEKSFNN